MRKLTLLAGLMVLGLLTWRIGGALSSDALGMAVGMVFGILAGIPAALLVLATSSRRRELERDEDERYERYHQGRDRQLPAYPYQPPVIVVAGAQQAQPPAYAPPYAPPGSAPYYVPPQPSNWGAGNGGAEAGGQGGRRFKIVGEREEWME